MKEKFKVAIVVVTFNRVECLKKCIPCLKKQTYQNKEIIIIDNASTDSTEEYCKTLDNVKYVKLGENNGGSYGFYYGIREASESEGIDLVWGMDDDAYANPDALENLIQVYDNGYSPKEVALWSNSHSHKASYTPGLLEEIRTWTFVGFMLSVDMIKKIGFPRNNLFIFYDDAEYANRILKNGYKILKVHDSIIIHEGAVVKSNIEGGDFSQVSLFGIVVRIQHLPDWKRYYTIRNMFLIQHGIKGKLYATGFALKQGFRIFLLQPKQIPIWMKAVVHGVIGKSGKVMAP